MPTEDRASFQPLLATIPHHLARPDDARRALESAEARYALLVKNPTNSPADKLALMGTDALVFRVSVREAATLVRGQAPELTADETALRDRIRKELARRVDDEDHFVARQQQIPGDPRLLIALASRKGDRNDSPEATRALSRATKLQPENPQVWRESGRVFAAHGQSDEAAARFDKALDLKRSDSSHWFAASGIHHEIARIPEVFDRLTRLRPRDRQLWIERVHFLAVAPAGRRRPRQSPGWRNSIRLIH